MDLTIQEHDQREIAGYSCSASPEEQPVQIWAGGKKQKRPVIERMKGMSHTKKKKKW